MKINIEIELADGEMCVGCPLVIIDPMDVKRRGEHYGEPKCYLYSAELTNDYIRPEICKEQNKEVVK